MNPGEVWERKNMVPYLPDYFRVESVSASGKSVRVVPCRESGQRIVPASVQDIRAWRLARDFELLRPYHSEEKP